MIQSILFFSLGFLCAALLALMVAPAVWRRAARLTRKRVEASIPLTLDEIQADKDRMRAEFAVAIRRLEVRVKELRDTANIQLVEIGDGRKQIGKLTVERDQQAGRIAELEKAGEELLSQFHQQTDKAAALGRRAAENERSLEERARELEEKSRELEELNGLYEEASLELVDRQAELLERTSEVEKLATDLDASGKERRETEKKMQELERELNSARERADAETKRAAERSDGEAELERKLSSVIEEKAALEARIEELMQQASLAAQSQEVAGPEESASPESERRLDERLLAMTRENRRLKAELKRKEKKANSLHADDSALREQMNDLAAEVISLTSKLDGPNSPIRKVLAAAAPGDRSAGIPTSLAERVLALRKAASDHAKVEMSESR